MDSFIELFKYTVFNLITVEQIYDLWVMLICCKSFKDDLHRAIRFAILLCATIVFTFFLEDTKFVLHTLLEVYCPPAIIWIYLWIRKATGRNRWKKISEMEAGER